MTLEVVEKEQHTIHPVTEYMYVGMNFSDITFLTTVCIFASSFYVY